MFTLMFRQLRHETARSLFMVLAVAAVIAEILILEGFLAGLYDQLRNAVLNRGGDLIVTQAGVSNFIATRSILPQVTRLEVEEVEGVRIAHPLTGISAIYERDGRRTPIMIVVFDTAGGPKKVVSGKATPEDRGIVIDRALAVKYGLAPGDPLRISDFEFKVSGVSEQSSAFLMPFAFITYYDLIDFYFESDVAADIATFPLLSFLLVDTEPGADPMAVAARIEERVDAADVFLPGDLARKDEALGRELLGPILSLLLVVSYGIGILVVGMFMFATVQGRRRTLGVLKALGFRSRALGGAVMLEAAILIMLALPVGVALSHAIAQIMEEIAPVYVIIASEPSAVARTALVCVAFAALGALIPVRAIATIDPAMVFRG